MDQPKKVDNINIWNEQWEVGSYSASSGLPNAGSGSQIRSAVDLPIPVEPNTEYYVYSGYANIRCLFYTSDNIFINAPTALRKAVITSPSNAKYMRFYTGSGYGATYNNDISINYPSTEHDYHKHV